MKKCKHIWKARLYNFRVCSSLENRDANFCRDETHMIKICTICGEVDIDTYSEKLMAKDFYNTPIEDMLMRYQKDVKELDDIISEETEEIEEG